MNSGHGRNTHTFGKPASCSAVAGCQSFCRDVGRHGAGSLVERDISGKAVIYISDKELTKFIN